MGDELDDGGRLAGSRRAENRRRRVIGKFENQALGRVECWHGGCRHPRFSTPESLDRHGLNGSGWV